MVQGLWGLTSVDGLRGVGTRKGIREGGKGRRQEEELRRETGMEQVDKQDERRKESADRRIWIYGRPDMDGQRCGLDASSTAHNYHYLEHRPCCLPRDSSGDCDDLVMAHASDGSE